MARILVSGATGFIGRALVQRLIQRGDSVTAWTRGDAPEGASGIAWLRWEPGQDGPWQDAIADKDAIVHLAGETAVGQRYTAARKEAILRSRVDSTLAIVRGIERIAQPERRPRVFVCASGIGFYGSRRDAVPLDESAPAGDDFLAQVCVQWEAAARRAESSGVRVVSTRIGFVLGQGGGALAKLVPIFKAFAGGPIGNGEQMVPWIHLEDVVGAMLKAIDDETLRGPVNLAAPSAVRNKDFAHALGHALKRPAAMPAPAFALRALYGEGAEPLLGGQNAVPSALLTHGYAFRFRDLDAALSNLLR